MSPPTTLFFSVRPQPDRHTLQQLLELLGPPSGRERLFEVSDLQWQDIIPLLTRYAAHLVHRMVELLCAGDVVVAETLKERLPALLFHSLCIPSDGEVDLLRKHAHDLLQREYVVERIIPLMVSACITNTSTAHSNSQAMVWIFAFFLNFGHA